MERESETDVGQIDMYLQGIAASLRSPMLSYLCNGRSCNYIGLGSV